MMLKVEKTSLSHYLTEREGRYAPGNLSIKNLNRLDKIDFNGKIHLSDKPSKTNMIIIHPGDLVISGINVSKGAAAVYEGDQPIKATIHYSSYKFNPKKLDIEYFKRFLKSPKFVEELRKQINNHLQSRWFVGSAP